MDVVNAAHPGEEDPIKATSDAVNSASSVNNSSQEPSLTNGHDAKPNILNPDISYPSIPSNAKLNGHVESHATVTSQTTSITEASLPASTLDTLSHNSGLPAPGDTVESLLPTSSQTNPEYADEVIPMNVDVPPFDATPASVVQPLSEMREQAEPTDPERAAEIKEQKQLQDSDQAVGVSTDPTPIESHHAEPSVAPQISGDKSLSPSRPAVISENKTEDQETQGLSEAMDTSFENTVPTETPMEVATEEPPQSQDMVVTEAPVQEAPIERAHSPKASTDPIISTPPAHESSDQTMQDIVPSPAKVAREREEDDPAEEPSAKRSKTEDEPPKSTEFKIPERPIIDTDVSGTQIAPSQLPPSPMTKPQQKYLLKIVGNVKRIGAAKWFTAPVDWEALNIPTYPTVISRPMDLKTLEDNLRADKYSTVEAAVADFNLIPENARTFNGPEHGVTVQANVMKANFDKALEKLPGPEVVENSGDRKRKAPSPGTVKIPPPRRESRSSLPGSARSPPASAVSPQTFALGPEGVPLIRRDSTMTDRPKREIHKPAPRDLPYANTKPKKKKYQWELKFCEKVLTELSKPKYQALSYPFMVPVDPVALNIPTYFQIIKKPMDFSKIRENLSQGQYENAKEFEADVRQVFKNCYLFNPPGDVIHNTGRDFEKVFDSEWSQKRQWIENNTPASGPQSPGSSEAEDSDEEDEEEEEEDEEEAEPNNELTKLQQHIAALSKQVEMIQKKKKSPPVATKKSSKAAKSGKKEKKPTPAAASKGDKKSAKPKKEKIPYVTYEQKQDISERINMLPDQKMATALGIIRSGMPNLEGVEQDEIELDIDELNNEVLYKLLQFVRKHAPRQDDAPAVHKPKATSSSAAPARKKNKPMSKHEQEARIAQVQNSLSAYQHGSPPAHSHMEYTGGVGDEDADSDDDESSEEE